jgi:hypothetical protein
MPTATVGVGKTDGDNDQLTRSRGLIPRLWVEQKTINDM